MFAIINLGQLTESWIVTVQKLKESLEESLSNFNHRLLDSFLPFQCNTTNSYFAKYVRDTCINQITDFFKSYLILQ